MTADFRVGRAQVIDIDNLDAAIDAFAGIEEKPLASRMARWCRERLALGTLPLRSDLIEAFAEDVTAIPVWLSAPLCSLDRDLTGVPSETRLLYDELAERAANADVLVINHYLLALHLRSPFLFSGDRPTVLVVDEADRFPDAVENISRVQVSLSSLASQARSVAGGETGDAVAVSALREACFRLAEDATVTRSHGILPLQRLSRADVTELSDRLSGAVSALDRILSAVPEADDAGTAREDIADLRASTRSLQRLKSQIDAGDLHRTLLYFSPVRQFPGLASVSAASARMIASRLWAEPVMNLAGLVFTSATLSTFAEAGDTNPVRALRPFASVCGFGPNELPADAFAVFAPTVFGRMDFVRPPLDAPVPFVARAGQDEDTDEIFAPLSPAAVSAWRDMISIASSRGGRVLVLVPSYRDVAALAVLEEDLGDRLVLQVPGLLTSAAKARFLKRQDAVWVSAAAWEGISLPGAIRHIVLPRLPIAPTTAEDSALEAYLRDALHSASKAQSVVFGRKMSAMRRRVRQGIGRGIRSQSDAVTIWIGDPRWPATQTEVDELYLDQPRAWSGTMLHVIPRRFRATHAVSERMAIPQSALPA
jgi:Rad3-related DNA helicase